MFRRGGLYSSFVPSGSADEEGESRPYRGAEIPPPKSLGTTGYPPKRSGFVLASSASTASTVQPVAGVNKQGYSTFNAISSTAVNHSTYGVPIKRVRTEEEYFEDDEDAEAAGSSAKAGSSLPYQPAPGSPDVPAKKDESDSEEDTLDAFMKNLEKKAKVEGVSSIQPPEISKGDAKKGVRQDIEDADDEESYYKWIEENPNAGKGVDDDDVDIEYDADGNPIAPAKSKYIDPLPPIDHSKIEYKPYEKNFYTEHTDIAGLSPIQVIDLQQKLGIRVSGASPPKPVSSFAHFGFDELLMKAIRKSEFTQPTPIQAQAIPAIMAGRDVIGIAKTGSGKTAAFLWPMLLHIMDQSTLLKGEGPIGLILVPTRELALQIYGEAKKFGQVFNLNVVCAYGGGSKWEQSKAFEAGAEIAIATPGRMIDMIKMKVTNLERVTYLVLDEADKMFEMGFEAQVRSICDHVRPDRQIMLFSATFKKKIERLARDSLVDPVKIVQGQIGEACEDVTQIVKVMSLGGAKWNWLLQHLVQFTSAGSVLIFVTKKANCEELAHNLQAKEFDVKLIHGDLNQHERNEIIHAFKKKSFPILVATDVAARGLDIPHIRTVVNFDVARDIDTHVHRIGRTGRAGIKGTAYTLVTDKDKEFVGHVVRNLEAANQEVSKELMDLAMKSSWFRSSRFKKGKLKGGNAGLGFQDRPGLGLSSPSVAKPSSANYEENEYLMSTATEKGGVIGGTNRVSAMRSTFRSQFVSSFVKGNDERTSTVKQPDPVPSMPPPAPVPMPVPPPGGHAEQNLSADSTESRKKKKSRWE